MYIVNVWLFAANQKIKFLRKKMAKINKNKQDKQKELIILVHGTWASNQDGWSSQKSYLKTEMISALKKKSLNEIEFEFNSISWSGDNSLYQRQLAAADLKEMINSNLNFYNAIHLIGHSHGGSIIQMVLHTNTLFFLTNKNFRSKIKSWTTLGTPFYEYSGILPATHPSLITLITLVISLPPFLIILNWLKSSITNFNRYYLYVSIIFILFPIIGCVFKFIRAKSFNSLNLKSFNYFANRWLGLYSKYDEAIVGLQKISEQKLKRNKRKLRAPIWGSVYLYPITMFYTFLYNLAIERILRGQLDSNIQSLATGTDKIFLKTKSVLFEPIKTNKLQFIPSNIEKDILNEVNKDNSKKIGDIRELLVNRSFNPFEDFSENEELLLVHSMYMFKKELIDIIAEHILYSNNNLDSLNPWLLKFKEKIRIDINSK